MANCDPETLRQLSETREIEIRTERRPKSAVVIWVVVTEDAVFVRSVYGAKGRWYRDLATGGFATVEFSDRRAAVRAIPESDSSAIDRVSCEYLRKYLPSPYAGAMVKLELLPTTLRLEPR